MLVKYFHYKKGGREKKPKEKERKKHRKEGQWPESERFRAQAHTRSASIKEFHARIQRGPGIEFTLGPP
jgi:hypothetical protein